MTPNMAGATRHELEQAGASLIDELVSEGPFNRRLLVSPRDPGSSLLVLPDGRLNVNARTDALREVIALLALGIGRNERATSDVAATALAVVPLGKWNLPDTEEEVRLAIAAADEGEVDGTRLKWLAIDGMRSDIQRKLPHALCMTQTPVVLHNVLVKLFCAAGAFEDAKTEAKGAMYEFVKHKLKLELNKTEFKVDTKIFADRKKNTVGPFGMAFDFEMDEKQWPTVPAEWSDPHMALVMSVIYPPVYHRLGLRPGDSEPYRIWRIPFLEGSCHYLYCSVTRHREFRTRILKEWFTKGDNVKALHLFDKKANLKPLTAAFYASWEACEFRLSLHNMHQNSIPEIVRRMGPGGDLVSFFRNPDRAHKFDQNVFYALPLFVCMALGWGNYELRLIGPANSSSSSVAAPASAPAPIPAAGTTAAAQADDDEDCDDLALLNC
jgi:hypothetical protein